MSLTKLHTLGHFAADQNWKAIETFFNDDFMGSSFSMTSFKLEKA